MVGLPGEASAARQPPQIISVADVARSTERQLNPKTCVPPGLGALILRPATLSRWKSVVNRESARGGRILQSLLLACPVRLWHLAPMPNRPPRTNKAQPKPGKLENLQLHYTQLANQRTQAKATR